MRNSVLLDGRPDEVVMIRLYCYHGRSHRILLRLHHGCDEVDICRRSSESASYPDRVMFLLVNYHLGHLL